MNRLVIIKGGGDLATGIAHRLFRCGFDVVITEIERPTVIRCSVAFANAIYEGQNVVEGVKAVKSSAEDIDRYRLARVVPVVVDPSCHIVSKNQP